MNNNSCKCHLPVDVLFNAMATRNQDVNYKRGLKQERNSIVGDLGKKVTTIIIIIIIESVQIIRKRVKSITDNTNYFLKEPWSQNFKLLR